MVKQGFLTSLLENSCCSYMVQQGFIISLLENSCKFLWQSKGSLFPYQKTVVSSSGIARVHYFPIRKQLLFLWYGKGSLLPYQKTAVTSSGIARVHYFPIRKQQLFLWYMQQGFITSILGNSCCSSGICSKGSLLPYQKTAVVPLVQQGFITSQLENSCCFSGIARVHDFPIRKQLLLCSSGMAMAQVISSHVFSLT